jgi:hypothetical protein
MVTIGCTMYAECTRDKFEHFVGITQLLDQNGTTPITRTEISIPIFSIYYNQHCSLLVLPINVMRGRIPVSPIVYTFGISLELDNFDLIMVRYCCGLDVCSFSSRFPVMKIILFFVSFLACLNYDEINFRLASIFCRLYHNKKGSQ